MSVVIASRYHDICTGHTVTGHEGKCSGLHGHNYRVRFNVQAPKLDDLGRVVDFSVIKDLLCDWLEENWDHKFLIWSADPRAEKLAEIDPAVVCVPFNPTAENMALYLLNRVGPEALKYKAVTLVMVTIEETPKCSVTVGV